VKFDTAFGMHCQVSQHMTKALYLQDGDDCNCHIYIE